MTLQIYVEGGGDRAALRSECRRGFSEFFRHAGVAEGRFRVTACGSREQAFRDFRIALANGQSALLLVDSEGPVTVDSVWDHLGARDNWAQPPGATEAHVHLMVQCMESWFLADRQTLARFFGKGFKIKALPGAESDVERISKADVFAGLESATKACKARYGKGANSFKILALIDPVRVSGGAPFARRLLDQLSEPA